MRTISTSLGPVAYERTGAGLPVVLLHANPGDRRDFAAVAPALAREFDVVAVDWPGYGDSPAPAAPHDITAVAFADLLPEIVTRLGIAPAILVGNSVGGFAAAQLAITHPALVRALVLVDTGGFTAHTPLSRAFCRLKGTETGTRLLAAALARRYLRRRTPTVEAMLARAHTHARNATAVTIDAALWRSFVAPAHDLRARAAAIAVPTLIVWGRRDPLLRWDRDGANARRAMPHARFVALDTGHAPFAEDPVAFLEALLPFLREHVAQESARGV